MYTYIVLTIFISVIVVYIFRNIESLFLKIIIVALLSFAAPFFLYWSPVWFGAMDDQYASWAPLVIGICFVAGVISGALGLISIMWPRRRGNDSKAGFG